MARVYFLFIFSTKADSSAKAVFDSLHTGESNHLLVSRFTYSWVDLHMGQSLFSLYLECKADRKRV